MFLVSSGRVVGFGDEGDTHETRVRFTGASSEYFETLHIPLLAGRTFSPAEVRNAAQLAIISESAARALFPGQNPIGSRLRHLPTSSRSFSDLTVIGIVRDIRGGPRRSEMDATVYTTSGRYLREYCTTGRDLRLIARTSEPQNIAPAVTALEPKALVKIDSMDARFALNVDRDRFRTLILGSLAIIAMFLAALGVYTVLSYSVIRRTRELGVRMALGAQRSGLFTLVFRRALLPGTIGLGAGLGGAYGLSELLAGYLFEVQPNDAPTYVAVTLLLAVILLIACAIPALRASRLDPMSALRHE